ENLIFLPWMKGERAPITDDYARGSFIGLTLTHRREHLIRAIMEGVAYNLQWIMDQIEHESRVRVSSLRAIGGGFQSKIWAQIISDIMRKKIEVVKWPQQAGAIGAALIAALGVGVFKKFDDLDRLSPVIFTATPKKEHRRTYTRMSSDYRRIYTEEMAAMYRRWGIP
ncbi:MAG: FGGY-family carbohydrate kinase, partial [Candidatus Bathyarchaeia archaeon]